MYPEFSFTNGLLYFTRAPGPRGFTWKFLLSYTVFLLFACVIAGFAMYPYFREIDVYDGGGPSLGSIGLALLAYPVFLVFWAVHEGAIQRRLVHAAGFSLKIGAAEFRLMGLSILSVLVIFLTAVVALLISGFFVNVAQQSDSVIAFGVVMALSYFFIGFAWFAIMAKLASASALTVRDGRFRFARSFSITRGRFWRIFWTYVLQSIAYYIFFLIFYTFVIGILIGFTSTGATFYGAFENATFVQLLIVGFVALLVLGSFALAGFYQLTMAGPGALAAVNDRNWEGGAEAEADVFS